MYSLSGLFRLNKLSSFQLSTQKLLSRLPVILDLILPKNDQLVLVLADTVLFQDTLKTPRNSQWRYLALGGDANEHQNENLKG